MIFVIIGPVDQQDRTRSNVGNNSGGGCMVVVYSIKHLCRDQSSRSEYRGEMTLRWNVALQSMNDIGIGAVGDDGLNRRFFGGCPDQNRSPPRIPPPDDGARPAN